MNKRMENAYNNWCNSNDTELRHVYGRPSFRKEDAWDFCKMLCGEYNGSNLRIISHNGFQFTAGFIYEEEGEKKFMYITKSRIESATI